MDIYVVGLILSVLAGAIVFADWFSESRRKFGENPSYKNKRFFK